MKSSEKEESPNKKNLIFSYIKKSSEIRLTEKIGKIQ